MKTSNSFILFLAGAFLLSACEKETGDTVGKDSIVQVRVVDEHGAPCVGVRVNLYDEKGYEQFEKNRRTPPVEIRSTDDGGLAEFRFPFREWFSGGSRVLTFVVREGDEPDNYRIWEAGRTIEAGRTHRIELRLERPSGGSPPAEILDMFDEKHGRTLFGNAVYMDAGGNFVGGDRCSFVEAGAVSGLDGIGPLNLGEFADRTAVRPGHGYWVVRDITLMEFPSGRWGLLAGSEFAKFYVSQWLYSDGEIIGARVHYAILRTDGEGLPAPGTVLEAKLSDGGTVSIPLADRNGDYEFVAGRSGPVEFIFGADDVTMRITNPSAAAGEEYPVYIRSGVCYTEIRLRTV